MNLLSGERKDMVLRGILFAVILFSIPSLGFILKRFNVAYENRILEQEEALKTVEVCTEYIKNRSSFRLQAECERSRVIVQRTPLVWATLDLLEAVNLCGSAECLDKFATIIWDVAKIAIFAVFALAVVIYWISSQIRRRKDQKYDLDHIAKLGIMNAFNSNQWKRRPLLVENKTE